MHIRRRIHQNVSVRPAVTRRADVQAEVAKIPDSPLSVNRIPGEDAQNRDRNGMLNSPREVAV